MSTEVAFESRKMVLSDVTTHDLDLPVNYRPDFKIENFSREHMLTLHDLDSVDKVVLQIGGNGGRLGEGVLTSAFIHPIHEVLTKAGKPDTPIKLVIDQGLASLYPADLYSQELGRPVEVMTVMPVLSNFQVQGLFTSEPGNLMVFDFHGGNGRRPSISRIHYSQGNDSRDVTVLSDLFKPAVRGFAGLGPEVRYSRFFEHMFALPEGSIDSAAAQPTILFDAKDTARYGELRQQLELRDDAVTIMCFFQSFVPAKCYGRWQEVLQEVSKYVAQVDPNRQIDCIMACAPSGNTRDRYTTEDIEAQFGDFEGTGNIHCNVTKLPSLRDLAIVARHSNIILSNDTGPAHIAGAVGRPVIVPFIPGDVLSKNVWSSARSFKGITVEPSPYTSDEIVQALQEDDFTVIDSIPSSDLVRLAVEGLSL